MGAIEDKSKWLFAKTLFLWLPISVIILIIQKWREERKKKAESEE